MFRKSDTQSSVTAAVHQRAFGRRMTSKYLKLQIHLAVGWQLWRKEGSLGRNRAGMIQGQLAERAEQAIIQKSETRLVRVVITALENRLVLLWQSSQGYWWAGGSSSQKPILPSLTVGATGLTPAPALSQLPFPPPPPPYFSWEQQLNPPLLSSSPPHLAAAKPIFPTALKNLELAQDAVQRRQPAFDRRSTAHWECQSVLLTSYAETLKCHFLQS